LLHSYRPPRRGAGQNLQQLYKEGAVIRRILVRLCSRYLVLERRLTGNAADPVANFHLRNGALLENIHCDGDSTSEGICLWLM